MFSLRPYPFVTPSLIFFAPFPSKHLIKSTFFDRSCSISISLPIEGCLPLRNSPDLSRLLHTYLFSLPTFCFKHITCAFFLLDFHFISISVVHVMGGHVELVSVVLDGLLK